MPASSKRSARAQAKRPPANYVTGAEGERRAIILGMDYYVKLLAELNTLRSLVKRHGLTPAPPAKRAPAGRKALR